MKIMLDCSPDKIAEYSDRYEYDFWQLRTPLTKYARANGRPYGLDNGCFVRLVMKVWLRLLAEARSDLPVFVCLPDIVGDAARTLELFAQFREQTEGLPRALVIQDGIHLMPCIPWNDIAAVFIGGSDRFKSSPEAFAVAKTAKMLGKHVHIGRVNTAARVLNWIGYADSCDGSGMSMYDHMLLDVLTAIRGEHPQTEMIDRATQGEEV
jgi:hypothetical protein